MERREQDSALEAILFALGEPVEEERLAQALACTSQQVRERCQALAQDYRWQMVSAPQYGEVIQTLLARGKADKLSPAALETLALVAYFQPVTRVYLDQARGVDCSHSLALLLERELVTPCGHLDAPGRPILYKTTPAFLRAFGLEDLEDLPPLPEEAPGEGEGEGP